MTDITDLALREKFEAWWEREYKHLESSKYTDAVPHIKYGFWMAYQAGGAEQNELARMALAAMESESHTDDELSNLLWYSQEATCHSDPNYYCEFQRLATPGFIAGIIRELQERRKADSEPVENHIGSKNALDAIVSFIKSKSNPTVKCYEGVSEQLFKDNCHGIHSHVIEYILKLGEELEDFRAEQDEVQPAQEYPETLPCPVLLEPGLRFGKGIKTSTMLAALARMAVHESDMAALSPEERAEFQAGIEDLKSFIAQPAPSVPNERDKTVDADDHPLLWSFNEGLNACRAAMLASTKKDEK